MIRIKGSRKSIAEQLLKEVEEQATFELKGKLKSKLRAESDQFIAEAVAKLAASVQACLVAASDGVLEVRVVITDQREDK